MKTKYSKDFVAITAAHCATYLKSLATGLRVEGKGNFVALLDKVVSVSFRSYKNESYRLIPQPSETAPRGGHRIERFFGSGSDEHPLPSDELELVFCAKDAEICFFHGIFIFSIDVIVGLPCPGRGLYMVR